MEPITAVGRWCNISGNLPPFPASSMTSSLSSLLPITSLWGTLLNKLLMKNETEKWTTFQSKLRQKRGKFWAGNSRSHKVHSDFAEATALHHLSYCRPWWPSGQDNKRTWRENEAHNGVCFFLKEILKHWQEGNNASALAKHHNPGLLVQQGGRVTKRSSGGNPSREIWISEAGLPGAYCPISNISRHHSVRVNLGKT